jgi:quinol monooxygenase YgiN
MLRGFVRLRPDKCAGAFDDRCRVRGQPENRVQFLEVLKAQAQTTRAEDGCQEYDVMLPNNDSKHVLVVEKWRDETSHSAHLNGPSFAKARDASKEWIVDRKVTSGVPE